MSWIKDFVILTVIVGILFGAMLGNYPLFAPDGARYAEIPREMVVTGDYVTPHLNYIKYFEKPPLFYWMQAAAIKAFGPNEFAANFPNAVLGLLTCLFVYFIGRKLFDRLSGFFASIILATSALFFAMAHLTTLDIALTFFLSSGLLCFILAEQQPISMSRSCLLLYMYAAFALAVLTKGLIGIVLPAVIIFLYILIFNAWRNLKTYQMFNGVLLFLIIALPWHILVQLKNPEFFHFYFIEQHFLRYLTPYAGREHPWWFFLAVAIAGFFPWVLFLLQSIGHSCPKEWRAIFQAKPTIFLLLSVAVILGFYSNSHSKLIPYILPIFPPLALITGKYLAAIWEAPKRIGVSISFYLLSIISILLGTAAIVAPVLFSFKAQAVINNNLIITGALLIFSGVVSVIIYRRDTLAKALIVYVVTFAFALISLCPILPVANDHSIKPLAMAIKSKLHTNDEVMSYATYYQDLPFYLERRITVIDYKGELEFGTRYQNTSDWMIDQKTFWQRWQEKKRVFLVLSKTNYESLKKAAPTPPTLIVTGVDDVVVSNQ